MEIYQWYYHRIYERSYVAHLIWYCVCNPEEMYLRDTTLAIHSINIYQYLSISPQLPQAHPVN